MTFVEKVALLYQSAEEVRHISNLAHNIPGIIYCISAILYLLAWFGVKKRTITIIFSLGIILMTVAFIVSIGCFWSWGVMHNFATEAAKRRRGYKGGFYDFAEKDVQTVPNWITRINMGFSLLGLILFICGILIEKV